MQRTYKDCISIKIAGAGLEAEASRQVPEAHNLVQRWPREAARKPEAPRALVLEVNLPEAAVFLRHPHPERVIRAESRLMTRRRFLIRGVEDTLVIDDGEVAEPLLGVSRPW